MKDALIVSLLSIFPRKQGAHAMGWFARTRCSRWLTRCFVSLYGLDLSEAEGTLADYPTLESLFTRRLRDGTRPIDKDPAHLVSPVDGTCALVATTRAGMVDLGALVDIGKLLGRPLDEEMDIVVLYLSPRDYHRVHVPREGQIVRWQYSPGTLWPVFPAAVRRISNLFALNERVNAQIATSHGPIDIVLVGAFGVGRISLSWCDLLTNTGHTAIETDLSPSIPVTRGAWLGTFHLGSTVILATPQGRWEWTTKLGESVRVGRTIARQRDE